MLVFLDTEFIEAPDGFHFISVALLSDDGGEFYVERRREEVQALLARQPNAFVQREVLPQLGRLPTAPWSDLPKLLPLWLDGLGAEVIEVIYDYSADYLMLEQMFAVTGVTPATRLCPTHVGYLLDDADGKVAAEAAWSSIKSARGLSRHHALADAYALRSRFESVHDKPL